MKRYYSDLVTRYARFYFRNETHFGYMDNKGMAAVKDSLEYLLPKDVEVLKQIYQPKTNDYYISTQVTKVSLENDIPITSIWRIVTKFETMVARRCDLA